MTTLTDFLLARIAEDEERITRLRILTAEDRGETYTGWAGHDRVLAECEAKRQIVGDHTLWPGWFGNRATCGRCYDGDDVYSEDSAYPCLTLRALATVYADHPDYDEAWRP